MVEANMRIPQLVLALAGTLLCTGCAELIGLHPFVTDTEAALDTRLLGVWTDDDDVYMVRQDGNGYTIGYSSEKKSSEFYKLKAKMLRVGEARILDLTPADEDAFRIAAHTPLRVWVEGATVRIAYLDSEWLRERASAQLAVQKVGDRLLITSPGEEVTRFLLTYGGDDRAFGKPSVLRRQE
jgi:hypothetical protein